MLFRMVKWGSMAAGGALLLGGIFLGTDLGSYAFSSARQVRQAVKDQVPVEFELQRARDLVEGIIPELRSNIRLIAEEEVQIAQLQREIEAAREQLDTRAREVSQLRGKLETQQVAYRINSREFSRSEITERLANRFEEFKQAESILSSKQKLLAAREKSLEAARRMLEKSRAKKSELEQKHEALKAQNRLVKAQESASEFHVNVDNTNLSRADELLSEIQNRLDVAKRVLEHESDMILEGDDFVTATVSEEDLLAEVDRHLGRDRAEVSGDTVVVTEQR